MALFWASGAALLLFSEAMSLFDASARKHSSGSPHGCLLSATKGGLLGLQFKGSPLFPQLLNVITYFHSGISYFLKPESE